MPNWTTNYIRFEGPENTIDRLVDAVSPEDDNGYGRLNFGEFIPEPHYKGNEDWYNWRVQHWGTKWPASDVEILEREPGAVTMRFDTAWTEPAAFYTHLEEKEGVRVIGGFIHEDGSEFEMWNGCYPQEFSKYFEVVEEEFQDEFDEDYSYTSRYIYVFSKEERDGVEATA